eukprot:TRINITY_DN2498_c0_g2_i1.p1 TRINITY_DN2498_c0_g2~~TRINITY_DN2498_c0_g2_i1.p1  ORF type:complete len:228 (+),score=66.62 TRINITY_DN2498_c0_g2_i1:28-684(+)
MPAPFCLLQPGYPPRYEWQPVGSGKWALTLQPMQAEQVVVFLTGQQPCPEHQGLAIYMSRQSDNSFEYLGSLRNDRPSGVFRVPLALSNAAAAAEGAAPQPLVMGISLEPLDTLANLDGSPISAGPMAAPGWAGAQVQAGARATAATAGRLTWQRGAQRLAADLAHWLGSFIKEDDVTKRSYLVIPQDFIGRWMQRVQTKLQRQPDWLDSAARIEQVD